MNIKYIIVFVFLISIISLCLFYFYINSGDKDLKNSNYQTTSVYGFGHPLYYNNVIDVLRGKAEPETDGREGLKSLEVIVASYLSAKDGETISLPLDQ